MQRLVLEGSRLRTIAKTHMNDNSSRSHTVLKITLTQTMLAKSEKDRSMTKTERVSRINLVDLAGSERLGRSGVSGERLTEACSINRSLSTLGLVINKLVERGKGDPTVFIPYRDSVLTWLLKESLGGNSRTVMIATVSRNSFNYQESLSTLRYANRAKNIKNCPRINQDATSRIINELREEIIRLKLKLAEHQDQLKQRNFGHIIDPTIQSPLNPEHYSPNGSLNVSELLSGHDGINTYSTKDALKEILDYHAHNTTDHSNIIKEVNTQNTPWLVNLGDETNDSVIYFLKRGVNIMGSSSSCDIVLLGHQLIKGEHCIIEFIPGEPVTIKSLDDNPTVAVNGQPITCTTPLQANDEITVAQAHKFQLRHMSPNFWDKSERQTANHTIQQESHIILNEELQELTRQKQQIQEELFRLYEERATVEEKNVINRHITTHQSTTNERDEQEQKQEALRKNHFQNELMSIVPKIKEANEISKQLEKGVKFNIKIVIRVNHSVPTISIQARDTKHTKTYLWSAEEFESRFLFMKKNFELYLRDIQAFQTLPSHDDPFYENNIFHLGNCSIQLQALVHFQPMNRIQVPVLTADFGNLTTAQTGDIEQLDTLGHLTISVESLNDQNLDHTISSLEQSQSTRELRFLVKLHSFEKDIHHPLNNAIERTYVRFLTSSSGDNYAQTEMMTSVEGKNSYIYDSQHEYQATFDNEYLDFEIFGEIKNEESTRCTSAVDDDVTSSSSGVNNVATTDSENYSAAVDDVDSRRSSLKMHFNPSIQGPQCNKLSSLEHINSLEIHIIRAENLPKMKLISNTSCYAKFKLFSETSHAIKKKSSVQQNTTSPSWNEKHTLHLSRTVNAEDKLLIQLADSDRLRRNTVFGQAFISFEEMFEMYQKEEARWLQLEGRKCQGLNSQILLAFSFE